jgi:hypothetical protein
MAFVATLTGTGRNCTLTSGSATMTVSSNTGLVVGATIQGTGIPAGTKITAIAGTTITMSANATAAGTQSLIFSSVYGSTLRIELTASGDVATWQNVFNAGFGLLQGTKSLFHPGALTVLFGSIVSGARFDHENWTVEIGSGGRMLFDSGLLAGEQRGGYDVAGSLLIKAAGPTFVFTNWNNGTPGGSSMFQNTGGLLTMGGLFRMHDARFMMRSLNINTAFGFYSIRDNMDVENLILDYSEHAGANASIGFAYGTVRNPKIINANSGFSSGNSTAIGTMTGLQFLGIFTDSPAAKFAIQNNYVMEGYAPQVTSAQTIGGFQANSTETFANIDLSTPGWGLNDLKTKYLRYGGPNVINFPRRVTFEFNDSTGANLTGVTLYVRSGSNTVLNAVQAGDYSANTQALVLTWNTTVNSYRVANVILDTISQIGQVRKYGFIEQSTSYSLNSAPYSQPFFMLTDTALAGIDEATAAAITTAGINWTTKTITPTADLDYDQINARMAWELAQTTNSAQVDPRTVVGDRLTFATGWTLAVNTGRTISSGTAITFLSVPTVTLNGTGRIQGLYSNSTGPNSILQLKNVTTAGVAGVWHPSTSATELFQTNVSGSATDYTVYYPPGSVGLVKNYARELYGSQRVAGSITLAAGLNTISFVDIPDVGITEPVQATVAAYTAIESPSKRYDRTAVFRLTEQGIKLGQIATRSGTSIEGTFSVKVRDDAPVVYSVLGNVITIKAASYDADAKYVKEVVTGGGTFTAFDTELIQIDVEDANGDSSVNVQGTVGGLVDVWKCVNGTINADFATGTKIASNISAGKYRFTGTSGFKLIFYDKSSLLARDCSMSKGNYVLGWYVYDQATGGLTQSQNTDFATMVSKVNDIFADVNSVTNGFVEATDSLHAIRAAVDSIESASLDGVAQQDTLLLTLAAAQDAADLSA